MAFRISFGILSLVILALCLSNYVIEYTPSWRDYQQQYYAELARRITNRELADRTRGSSPRFEQIYNPELGVVDRCTICHLGIDNQLMADAPNPFKLHPGDLLKSHPHQRFGCTICHQGDGRATTWDAQNGHVIHEGKPVLAGRFVQASCAKCHHGEEVPQAPMLSRGRRLIRELGCTGCHKVATFAPEEKVGPRLNSIGSKVSKRWLVRWLASPTDYLPNAMMPHYDLSPSAVNALADYLLTLKDQNIDDSHPSDGDADRGANVYRESQCTVCHWTRQGSDGQPVGGTIGPSLLRIGNKTNKRWLSAFLSNPHIFYPNTKMPRFHFTDQEVADLVQYATQEWVDAELVEQEEKAPQPPLATPESVGQGKLLFDELGCGGCHDLGSELSVPIGPELTYMGSKLVHDLDFGDAMIRHTVPEFIFTKLVAPKPLHATFRLPPERDLAAAIWESLQPTALFSKSRKLLDASTQDRLAWVLEQAKKQQVLQADLAMPGGTAQQQALWLASQLDQAGALNPLKMPRFRLADADAEAVTIALMSLTDERVTSEKYILPPPRRPIFNPKDRFGELAKRYRCLSCHSVRGDGTLLASDLTLEGSKVNREWLYHYLVRPYSMRRLLTIAMPIFHFPDEDAKFMADYVSAVFVDRDIDSEWNQQTTSEAKRGEELFVEKGCVACHQVQGKGGDVGPSLTTQVPEFPHGTWVGDKLNGSWIYRWLKDPHTLVPEAVEPNYGLTDTERADLTAYLLSLKSPEFQGKP